ncbi:hypothetical protein I553_0210 [Mycobacterium xenopi 4042]|uniref:Potassium/proton antiporter subunit KhtT-like N-terminal domain-containing protein n=1 Tax=Mycobacterium xenopi 4042 TaxID=1299334 RepID=X7YLR2_MYCXE|nr:hypothetical protein I553_0210 [Mycobacterium xenopi 4042]
MADFYFPQRGIFAVGRVFVKPSTEIAASPDFSSSIDGMDVKEVLLPGVGLRYEFASHEGDRIGIIAGAAATSRSSYTARGP